MARAPRVPALCCLALTLPSNPVATTVILMVPSIAGVHCPSEDDVRIRVGDLADDLARFGDLRQSRVGATDDAVDDSLGAVNRDLKQRAGDRRLGGIGGALVALAFADGDQRRAGLLHDGADVVEVQIDAGGHRDQLSDALDALAQHLVGNSHRLGHGRSLRDDGDQSIVRYDYKGVDLLAEGDDAFLGVQAALRTLEGKRLRDNRDGQRADLAGELGDDRSRAGCRSRRRGRRE